MTTKKRDYITGEVMTPEFLDYLAAINRRSDYRGCARVKAEGTFSTCNTCGGGNPQCPIRAEYDALTIEIDKARERLEKTLQDERAAQ